MMQPPNYFTPIREKAARRWEQLEQDRELAGPWHQLFKQVQSPRHILSELLQNADDAKATEARVRVEEGYFVFEHNGEDFAAEHFGSLCRFGYSNKRALHTIGFRGVGFKSTFSLGDRVELETPSLSLYFEKRRFTEPVWSGQTLRTDGKTCIRVKISDKHRQLEVEKNLEEWLNSPVSLLFFKHLRLLQIGEKVLQWERRGSGPVADSAWMVLAGEEDEPFLLLHSSSEDFPPEELAEVRQERMLTEEEESDFPPCRVDIVLGAPGRLFVVLPTGVETGLPFSCNAPFIQDPARLKIKDPETSPTNRWLLERCGKLAATALLSWLAREELSFSERAKAYKLFPDVKRDDNTLGGVCGKIVEEALEAAITGQAFLLTNEGALTKSKGAVLLPSTVSRIWPAKQATELFDLSRRPPLAHEVASADCKKLLNWGVLEEIGKATVLSMLQRAHLPKPATWEQLLLLWVYIAPEVTGYWPKLKVSSLKIVPVQGKEVLYTSEEVVRLGEKKLLHAEADWHFLGTHLLVVTQKWLRYLAEEQRAAKEQENKQALQDLSAAYGVLQKMSLLETSDVSKVIARAASGFFAAQEVSLAICIQLAQIAAKLGASIDSEFRFATRELTLREPSANVFALGDPELEELVPPGYREAHFLHPDYVKTFSSCSREEWDNWVRSGKAGLLTFVPFSCQEKEVQGRPKIEKELARRGQLGRPYYHYVTSKFIVEDWDFEESYWLHWYSLAKEDDHFWGRFLERFFAQPPAFWSKAVAAKIVQVATTGSKHSIAQEQLLPSWVLRLRDLACLPDTRGFFHKPGELLRRTPETEALLDLEPFVARGFDHESTQPLLDLLDVRKTPTGPDRLLDCLRALSKAPKPPVHEVEKWYRRLDQLIFTASTEEAQKIKQVFQAEKLILSTAGSWETADGIFLTADELDAPGTALIPSAVADLTLWLRIGVEERPTAELALKWLKGLPSGQALTPEEQRRVRALQTRHSQRIWRECGHWLTLAGEWCPVGALPYSLSMQSLVPWGHLHEWVKQKTADVRGLTSDLLELQPFCAIPTLASQLEERFAQDPSLAGQAERKAWVSTLGEELKRLELEEKAEQERVRALGERLAETTWQRAPGLELLPYLGGIPAGLPRRADVVWLAKVLYVEELPKAKLAKRVPEELGRFLAKPELKAALDYSFERSAEEVRAYLEENFKLAPRVEKGESVASSQEQGERISQEESYEEPKVSQVEAKNVAGEWQAEELGHATMPAAGPLAPEEEVPGSEPGGAEIKPKRTHPEQAGKPTHPSLIERFALRHGFHRDGENRYYHADGSWLTHSSGNRFPWERRSASGILLRFYWPKDHCLAEEPLQLEADVWGLLDRSPAAYALLLADSNGEPVELLGEQLRRLQEQGKLKLYPATYRLVAEGGQNG